MIVLVVVLPIVEADNGVVVEAKIIANVKVVVAAIARYAFGSRDILVILLFIVFILRASWDGNLRIKEFPQRNERSKKVLR